MPRKIKRFGWIPDLPDHRDLVLVPQAMHLPTSIDLRDKCPPVYDQGELGSCTGNACEALFRFQNRKQTGKDYQGSRLFCYYNGRSEEGTEDYDSGAALRDVIKAIRADGVTDESCWPYDISRFAERAPQACYDEALRHQSLKYHRIRPLLNAMKTCLAQGNPFVFGFTVYESFESDTVARSGIVPLPHRNEEEVGGHAVMAVGYDDNTKQFIVRNSWSPNWGVKGYFFFPYDYILNPDLADDLWTITLLEAPQLTH